MEKGASSTQIKNVKCSEEVSYQKRTAFFLLWRKPVSWYMITPLAPAQPPLGEGAHVMPRYYLYKNSLAFFVNGYYGAIIIGAPPAAG